MSETIKDETTRRSEKCLEIFKDFWGMDRGDSRRPKVAALLSQAISIMERPEPPEDKLERIIDQMNSWHSSGAYSNLENHVELVDALSEAFHAFDTAVRAKP